MVWCAEHYDPYFTIWPKWLRWLAAMMLGPGKWANALRDAAAKEFAGQAVAGAEGQGDNKDAHRARLRQLESLCGNSITLSAVLMHNWNFWHMRLIMRRLHLFAKEQCFNATQQKTPNQHLSTSSD